jgi:hypothetical protein
MSEMRRVMLVVRAGLMALILLVPGAPAAAQAASDLHVSVGHAPEPARMGSDLSFEVDVSNAGTADATGVQIVVRFPDADAVLASAQAGQGTCTETAPGEVTCGVGTLAEGAAVSVQVVVTPVNGTVLPASAEADSIEDGPAPDSDSASVSGQPCDVVGTQGDDILVASSPGDVVCGLGGNDSLTGVEGNETLNGGPDQDRLAGAAGSDELDGGDGRDVARYSTAPARIVADLEAGTVMSGTETDTLAGVEDLTGSPFQDRITGSSGPNRLAGGDALDLLFGGGGADVLLGEGADDYLNGGAEADALDGGPGSNTCVAETGTTSNCRLNSPGDPNDAIGRLDVQRVNTRLGATTSLWTFVTREQWTLHRIWDEGYAVVFLDTAGNSSAEYHIVVRVRSDGRGMTAFLKRLSDNRQWTLDAWKQSLRSMAVRLPMSRVSFGSDRIYYRWWGQTIFPHPWCRQGVCFDGVPGTDPSLSLIQPVP